jgi:hypothetical protein
MDNRYIGQVSDSHFARRAEKSPVAVKPATERREVTRFGVRDVVVCENPGRVRISGNWRIDADGGRLRLTNLSPA